MSDEGKEALEYVLKDYIEAVEEIKKRTGIKAKLRDLPDEISRLQAENKALREALEPYATFGKGEDEKTEEQVEDMVVSLMRDRVCDWFGPSDFRRARAALKPNGGEG